MQASQSFEMEDSQSFVMERTKKENQKQKDPERIFKGRRVRCFDQKLVLKHFRMAEQPNYHVQDSHKKKQPWLSALLDEDQSMAGYDLLTQYLRRSSRIARNEKRQVALNQATLDQQARRQGQVRRRHGGVARSEQ